MTLPFYGYIYTVTNQINEKQIVGQTLRHCLAPRRRRYLKPDPKDQSIIARAIRKYGAENFVFEPIFCALDKETLDWAEDYFIMELNTLAPYGYNLRRGGANGIFLEEVRKRISAKGVEIWKDSEYRAAQIQSRREAWANDPNREKRIAEFIAIWDDPTIKAKHKASLIASWTEERRNWRSELSRSYWSDNSNREHNGAIIKQMWANLPPEQLAEISAERSTNATAQWADETKRETIMNGLNVAWGNEQRRSDTAARTTNQWEDPVTRALMIEKLREGQRRRWARVRGDSQESP